MYANNPEILLGNFEAKTIQARIPLVSFISPLLKDNQSQQRHSFTRAWLL